MTMVEQTARSEEAGGGKADMPSSEVKANEYKQKGNQCFKGRRILSVIKPPCSAVLRSSAIDRVVEGCLHLHSK